jgi:hypothetical protein
MAGYSGTPLPQKLGIKPGSRLALVGAPDGFDKVLGPLPDGVRSTRSATTSLDVAVIFSTTLSVLKKKFPAFSKAIAPSGALWIAWPKKSSGVPTELDENVVRAYGLESGLVDVKVCAIDETWSGLKFVVRRADRPTTR